MKIYNNGHPTGQVSRWLWRLDDAYFLRLEGIDFRFGPGGIDVQPRYLPLLRIVKSLGTLRIDVSAPKQGVIRILFLRRKPFIWIERLKDD
jgi:hypothetical protein